LAVLVLVAFAAGVFSFFSPCVWPLYPAYVAQAAAAGRAGAVPASAAFAAGFTAVFVALGASASALGHWLQAYQLPLQKVSGLLIVLLGLALAGILPEHWLGTPRALAAPGGRSGTGGPWSAALLGMAFAFGWTPCVGPVLASILLLASSTAHLLAGTGLLLAYSAGFAVPFLGLAALAARGARLLPGLGRWLPHLQRAGGLLLAVLGVLVFTGSLASLSTYLYGWV
jgi:cytochrome c-type biogenesis protein